MIVYKLTSPSGKSYIGKTKASLKERLKQHISLWNLRKKRNQDYRGCPTKLFYAFDKYGPESFVEEILYECQTLEEVNLKEKEYIERFGDYNISKGGDGRLAGSLDERHKENIRKARNNWWKTPDGIARKNELSQKMMGNKNQLRHKYD